MAPLRVLACADYCIHDLRLVDCPNCGGETQFEHLTGYDPHDGSPRGWIEPCETCKREGAVFMPAAPIEQCDLSEMCGG